jgi:NAD(P)-dependent dehydrogenase (short-subunit alcohol dehydrogenase family)
MDLGIAGKRALVTGGTLGIGKAIAIELLSAGASVIVTGRDADRLAMAVADLNRKGVVTGIASDLRPTPVAARPPR